MTDSPVDELPEDVNLIDLTRDDLERRRSNRQAEADFQGWHVLFTDVQQADGKWTLQVRYAQGGDGTVNPDLPDKPPVRSLDAPSPPPPGPVDRFVSARRTLPTTVVYIDTSGRDVVREGGSRSWRNCNPGNVRKGDFASSAGAIGDDGAFAIFPDQKTGFAAIGTLLTSVSYRSLSLRAAIFKYAPPNENDSEAYTKTIVTNTGIPEETVLSTLSAAQIRTVAAFIQKVEGWKTGSERPNLPNSSITLTGGGISSSTGAAQDWMIVAQREATLPVHERSAWPGTAENPRILEYFRIAAPWFEPGKGDKTDWCAAFVNFCLVSSGHVGTDHPGARSFFWNRKGQFVRLDTPVKGAIAVRRYTSFDDPQWSSGEGHVGFVVGFTPTTLTLLGGNQSGSVNVAPFPIEETKGGKPYARFVSYMMPVIT